jgi:hypothetical protein
MIYQRKAQGNMNNPTNIVDLLTAFSGILATIAAIITSSIVIAKKWQIFVNIAKNSLLYKTLLKAVGYLLFFLSLAVPNGLMTWFMFYQVGRSPLQILEPVIFFSVILQTTAFVSIYSFLWGVWLVPLLRRSSQKQEVTKG